MGQSPWDHASRRSPRAAQLGNQGRQHTFIVFDPNDPNQRRFLGLPGPVKRSPFRRTGRRDTEFGRKRPRWSRWLPGLLSNGARFASYGNAAVAAGLALYEYWPQGPNPVPGFGYDYWWKYRDCNGIENGALSQRTTVSYPGHCIGNQAMNWGNVQLVKTVPTSIVSLVYGFGTETAPGLQNRLHPNRWYMKHGAQPTLNPQPIPRTYPVPVYNPVPAGVPAWAPNVFPSMQPIGAAGFDTATAVPYRAIPDARRYGDENHEFGPLPVRRYDPAPDAELPPVIVEQPGIGSQPRPNPPTIRLHPRPTDRQPPKKREKEKKLKMRQNGVTMFLGAITEGVDLINAFFWALPKEYRAGARTQNDRIWALWQHFEHINVIDAVQNAMLQELQDTAIGRLSRMSGGNLRGPWDTEGQRTEADYEAGQRNIAMQRDTGYTREEWDRLAVNVRAAVRRRLRQERRARRQAKIGGSNLRNTGTVRYAKRRDGTTFRYLGR